MKEHRVKPIPNMDTAAYFGALADGRLMATHCGDCSHWTWPPRPVCSRCHGENLSLDTVRGTGAIYSWIVVHRSTTPDMMEYVPYTLALVRLDEQDDIYIPGRLLSDVEAFRGMRVQADPKKIGENIGDVIWKAIESDLPVSP